MTTAAVVARSPEAATLPTGPARRSRTALPSVAPDRQRSWIGMNKAGVVENGVLVGVVGGAGFHECLHQRGLAREGRARNQERAVVQGDHAGVNEQPVAWRSRQSTTASANRAASAPPRAKHARPPGPRRSSPGRNPDWSRATQTGSTRDPTGSASTRAGGSPGYAAPASGRRTSARAARRTPRSSPSRLTVSAAAPWRSYAVGQPSPISTASAPVDRPYDSKPWMRCY